MKRTIRESEGNIIEMANEGLFGAILHGVNCFCVQKSGLAPQMVEAFKTDNPELYPGEAIRKVGDINKLGTVELHPHHITIGGNLIRSLIVINAYTQYHYRVPGPYGIPLDYEALQLCFRKINVLLLPETVLGIPRIGCGLAGGNWDVVKRIIENELTNIHIHYVKLPS